MILRFLLTLLCCFHVVFIIEARDIFVSSSRQACKTSCSGNNTDPFDNILQALENAASDTTTTTAVYLLQDDSAPHFILLKEYTGPSDSSFWYDESSPKSIYVNDVVIKPVFCDEEPALSDLLLASQCIPSGEKMKVYLKTTDFSLTILSRLDIQSIAFDASENILPLNSTTKSLSRCLYSRERCCQNGQIPDSPASCFASGSFSTEKVQTNSSLFRVIHPDITNSSAISLRIKNTDFINFLSLGLASLIATGHSQFSLDILSSTINNIFFNKGLIHHTALTPSEQLLPSNITITNFSFINYNPHDLIQVPSTYSEGYLFMAEDSFYGRLSISNSTFANATTSLQDYCPSLS